MSETIPKYLAAPPALPPEIAALLNKLIFATQDAERAEINAKAGECDLGYAESIKELAKVKRAALEAAIAALVQDGEAYRRINTPEIDDFLSAVRNEALHQRERWGVDQDGGKADADWFWLLGYLAGKALHDVNGKRLHHIITSGAALLNWHAHAIGAYARMRPGIEEPR
jgi:hypothetical protein